MVEGYLHIILRLTLLNLAISLGLLSEQVLKDGLVLPSRFVLQQDWSQSTYYLLPEDVGGLQFRIGLPGLFESDHILDGVLSVQFLLLGLLGNPRYQFLLLDDRLPLLRVPLELSGLLISDTGGAADEDNAGLVALTYLHKAEHENVGVAADEAFDGQVAELPLGVGCDFVVLGLDQVEDDVRREPVLALPSPRSTFSLQNHFPQVLLAQRTTQDLLRTPQKAQAWGGTSSSAETVEERSDSSSDYDLGLNIINKSITN